MKTTFKIVVVLLLAMSFSGCTTISKCSKENAELVSQNDSLVKANIRLETELKNKKNDPEGVKEDLKLVDVKYNPEIDAMLNIDDSTVFDEKFMQFDLSTIHPRSREMYQWVAGIHELGEYLKQIEKSHLTIEDYNKNIADLPSTTVEKLKLLNIEIKKDITDADNLRQEINKSYAEMEKAFTKNQMEYYIGLRNKLNNFMNIYF